MNMITRECGLDFIVHSTKKEVRRRKFAPHSKDSHEEH